MTVEIFTAYLPPLKLWSPAMHPLIWLVPAFLSAAAVAPLPYGYYTLLRVVVCVAAAFIGWKHYTEEDEAIGFWVISFTGVAVLFNPLIPVYLTREIWAPIDLGVAALFVTHFFLCRRKWLAE